MRSFRDIGSGLTDKVTHHRYDRYYPLFTESMREEAFAMLEIGIATRASLELWSEYFPKAKIFGIDINVECEHGNCRVFRCDQSDPRALAEVAEAIPKCRIIVDDGSHNPGHQIDTFEYLFSALLEPGGIYVVEDIETSYWDPSARLYGYQIGSRSLIEHMKSKIDGVNCEFSRTSDAGVSLLSFGQNCVFVKKQEVSEAALFARPYRLRGKLPDASKRGE